METAKKYGLGKSQRIKSRKQIQTLFDKGTSFHQFPIKVIWMPADIDVTLQAAFTVSSRLFKKATDRNRIKRLMRECYRLQKQSLEAALATQNRQMQVFFIYIGKEHTDYIVMQAAMQQILKKLQKQQDATAGS